MPSKPRPSAGPLLPEDAAEVLTDALDSRNKTAESYNEDLAEAFKSLPRENIEAAAAVCRDMGNEAMKNQRYDEAVHHYTSVLAAHPHDHEVLANRSLAHLHLKHGPEALNDAALCVNLKPNWAKGYYRMGCALEECKAYKESASVFAKVVEMEPENAEASGRLMKARHMLEMVMNVERVNDPMWMHKPAPPKTDLQIRTDEAQDKSSASIAALREEMGARPPTQPHPTPPNPAQPHPVPSSPGALSPRGAALASAPAHALHAWASAGKATFDFELCRREMGPADKWYAESIMAKGLNAHLTAHSAVLAPRKGLSALLDRARTDAYAEAVRRHVAELVPQGHRGVVLHLGTAMGLLPLLALEAGANRIFAVEPCGFLGKLAHAQVQRHALLSFERDNWSRMPMSLPLAERCRQAGGAAFKCAKYEKAVALYTEALQAARSLHGGAELISSLLCNRALCYLRLKEPTASLADAREAQKARRDSSHPLHAPCSARPRAPRAPAVGDAQLGV